MIFGTPVYAGRVPNKVLPMIQGLFQGNDAFAVPVVTFGNRNYDNALIELRNELENNHFHTIAAGAFVAQHAFTDQLATMRPGKVRSGRNQRVCQAYRNDCRNDTNIGRNSETSSCKRN